MAAPKCQRKAQGRHSTTLLTCRLCGVSWCWSCALHYGKSFGPSQPGSGWALFKKGDPAFLVFTCPKCDGSLTPS